MKDLFIHAAEASLSGKYYLGECICYAAILNRLSQSNYMKAKDCFYKMFGFGGLHIDKSDVFLLLLAAEAWEDFAEAEA